MQSSPTTALDFWNENEIKQDQMLYTAFCLLESAISNYVAGHFLRDRKVFDWAATSFYYSSLYSVRLVVFVGYGDFPEGHKKIGLLFKNGRVEDKAWLLSLSKKIKEYSPARRYPYFGQNPKNVRFDRDLLRSNLYEDGVNLEALSEAFDFFGKILTEATVLRNDSSYESLLVAHQYSHVLVTERFKELVDHFEKLSQKAIKHASRVFREFVKAHTRRDYFCAFLIDKRNTEGVHYLEDSLKNKEYPTKTVEAALDFLTPLVQIGIRDDKKAERFHSNIAIERFDEKKELMQNFGNRVRNFGVLLSRG